MKRQDFYFTLFAGLSIAIFWSSLKSLAALSLRNDSYSHVILIPLVSAVLLYMERKRIFVDVERCLAAGAMLLLAGMACFFVGEGPWFALHPTDHLSLTALSLVLVWMGGFVFFYGRRAFRAAAFPLLFLLLMVPIPAFLLDRIIFVLRQGSAEALGALYAIVGVPFLRKGFTFSLPGVNITIAKECSGIRSSIALFITVLLASHFFLRTAWRKAVLILFLVPIVILKNAIRIATISLLSVYVNPGYINGRLHHKGGILFAILAVGMLLPVLCALQRSERYSCRKKRTGRLAAMEHSVAR